MRDNWQNISHGIRKFLRNPGLARISHKKPTKMSNLTAAASLNSFSLLDVLQVRLCRLQLFALHQQPSLPFCNDFS
jgi:hypothetical protein